MAAIVMTLGHGRFLNILMIEVRAIRTYSDLTEQRGDLIRPEAVALADGHVRRILPYDVVRADVSGAYRGQFSCSGSESG